MLIESSYAVDMFVYIFDIFLGAHNFSSVSLNTYFAFTKQ